MFKDRHAKIERKCEYCGTVFTARVERVNKGQGRFCSLKCANNWQKSEGQKTWGFENGKKYWDGSKWIVQWQDEKGMHNTSYAKWWWTLNVGEVPNGYVISLKDKNPENISPDNFECVSKGSIWVSNGKGNKARTGLKWDEQHRLDISNRMSKQWAEGKFDNIHKGENHHHWRGGSSSEEYPKEFYAIRDFVLTRDQYQCRVCGKSLDNSKFRHVHHRDGNKQNNDQNNLLSLCVSCHGKVHSSKTTSSEVILVLRSELFWNQ